MMLSGFDPDFRVMFNYSQANNVPVIELSKRIRQFRNKISLNWINQFSEQNQVLSDIFEVLFKLSNCEDQGIRISVNNTIGALLFLLTPFIPRTIINSFASSVKKVNASKYSSITIIACFCHLSNYVSLLELKSFVSRINIFKYFNEDLNENLKFLPKLLKETVNLDKDFHLSLMRTLLKNFGAKPSFPLVNSIIEITKHNPEIIIEELIKCIEDKEMEQLLLMITPILLKEESTRIYLKNNDFDELFNLAISVVKNENLGLKEFEYAIKTISSILKYSNNNLYISKIEEALNSRKLPDHLKIFAVQVSNNIDELKPKENDSVHLKLFKLNGIANILQRDNNLLINVLPILDCYLNQEGEVYTKLMEIFSDISGIITFSFLENENIHHYVLKFVSLFINKDTEHWVQSIVLLRFIQNFDVEIGNYLINNYEKIVLKIIFKYCFSQQEHLSNESLKTLSLIIRYDSINYLIELLLQSDFFDDFKANKSVQIINEVSNIFNPFLFKSFESLIVESILLNPTYIKFICSSIKYLNSIKSNYKSQEIVQLCFDLISKIFKSFTGINKNLYSTIVSQDLPPISTLIETNIVSRTFDSSFYLMETIQQCIIYLNRCKIFNESLLMISIQLMKIYPIEILTFIDDYIQSNTFLKSNSFGILLKDVILSANNIETASFCLKYYLPFINLDNSISKYAEDLLLFVNNGRQLYFLYLLLSESKQQSKCDEAFRKLDQQNKNLFYFYKIKKSLNEILEWLNDVPFVYYPIHDKTFIDFLEENINSINYLDYESNLSKEHILFISKHSNLFDDELIQKIKQKNKFLMFRQFKNDNYYIYHELNVNIKEFSIHYNLENKLLICPTLVNNFFEFSSNVKVGDDLFNELISYLFENQINLTFALKYATNYKIKIHKEILTKIMNQIHEPNLLLNLTKYMLTMEYELPNFYNKKTSLILLDNKVNENDSLILINPEQLFTEFIKSYNYKSKESKSICYFINRYDINPEIIINFIYRKVQNIGSISSIKKLLFFFKIIHLFFYKLYINKVFDISDVNSLILEIISSISFLDTCKYASVHHEISNIFCYFPYFIKSFDQVICFLDNVYNTYGSSILYLIPSCNIANNTKNYKNLKYLTSDLLNHLIKLSVPSFILNVQRSIYTFLSNHSNIEICFYLVYPSILDVLKSNGNNIFIQKYISKLLKIISSEQKYSSFQRLIYPDLKYFLTVNIQKKTVLKEFALETYKLLFSQNT